MRGLLGRLLLGLLSMRSNVRCFSCGDILLKARPRLSRSRLIAEVSLLLRRDRAEGAVAGAAVLEEAAEDE